LVGFGRSEIGLGNCSLLFDNEMGGDRITRNDPTMTTTSTTNNNTNRTAIVFDYDWSLINCNSDTYVFEQLWPERPRVVQEVASQLQWTAAVDRAFHLLHEDQQQSDRANISTNDILQCVARVPVQEFMLEAVKFAHERDATLYIVSDANTLFIEAFLQAQKLSHLFEAIISNGALVGERFSVQPYHDFDNLPPHGCPHCPPNMCKGAILEEVQVLKRHDRVIYIGDGGGDYCPSTRLRKGDTVLARRNYVLSQKIAAEPIQADVREWETGGDVLRTLQEILGDNE
jgi:pyridoxal phosphate phosphatase PHOSPHO2